MTKPNVRRQSEYKPLTKEEFRSRFDARFYDPAFDKVRSEINKIFEVAWDGYIVYRRSPKNMPAGDGFAEPDFQVAAEWLKTKKEIDAAQDRQNNSQSPSRVLIVNASTRSEHTCPGEISKTRRLADRAQQTIKAISGYEVDFLDLSTLADEPMKVIHPCKACFSTSPALCHWPCSCYPNHALGQTNDWMNEIYPRWVAAHAVMILCPVHWYQAPASLKLMMDRLVCADGGNADPTTSHGKDPVLAKQIELAGWDYPKHLAGRAFSVVVHGDSARPENLRRIMTDWLTDMGLIQAGPKSTLDTWIGWHKPYSTSHEDLDANTDVFLQVENAARALARMVEVIRSGQYKAPDEGQHSPIRK